MVNISFLLAIDLIQCSCDFNHLYRRIIMAKYWFLVWSSICFLSYCSCSESPHRDLRDYLMQNYDGVKIRPVHRVSTLTNVTYRPIFVNLVEMDIKNQRFSMTSNVKTTWKDEFLRWNASEFDDIHTIYLDSGNIWLPDITLTNNPEFPDMPDNSLVEIQSDGTVLWYYIATIHSNCAVNVKWFPFDTQVCIMKFTSWAYNGQELNLSYDDSVDGDQTRFLHNGVWDLIDVSVKKYSMYYPCCEYPYYTLDYRIIFRRQPHFYITYIIVPVVLLYALSVSVFLLPATLSAKLQFSITNLLAVAFFEKLVAEVIPPSSENSPIIDTYFEVIFIMVSLSVVATVSVMNISSRSRDKPPKWFSTRILPNLSQMLCICKGHMSKKKDKEEEDDYQLTTLSSSSSKNGDFEGYYNNMGFIPEANSSKIPNGKIKGTATNKTYNSKTEKADYADEWKHIGHVLTRFYAVLFGLIMGVSTVLILLYIKLSSEWEFEDNVGKHRDEWLNETDNLHVN